jgi:hypothetical protein
MRCELLLHSVYQICLNSERYDTVEASSLSPNGLAGPSAWTSEVLEWWLLEHACAISPGHYVDPRTDLFAQGFDRCVV